jgi:glycosyltransferase involved in cell wall biosynthesis
MQVTLYHNILWPKHIGAVFSKIYSLSKANDVTVSVVHIAETELIRTALSGVDTSYHQYPYRVLFSGNYEDIGKARMCRTIVRTLLSDRSDAVVLPGYHLPEFWLMLAVCVLKRQTRLVFVDSTQFDRPKSGWRETAKRWFFLRCDGFLCFGVRSKEYVMSYGIAASKAHPGVQATALAHDYDEAHIQRSYDATPAEVYRTPRFIYIGRLAIEKGLHDLIDAFKIVHDREPEARLDVIGAGDLRDALAQQITKLDLDDSVSLLGTRGISEFAPMLMRSVAMVLPSYSEPWGLVVNEALSYGCPVVVSDRCGCVPELVLDGVTGYSFAVGNAEDLCSKMLAAIRLSDDRPATVKRCLEVMSNYTPERAAQRILDGCKAAIASRA